MRFNSNRPLHGAQTSSRLQLSTTTPRSHYSPSRRTWQCKTHKLANSRSAGLSKGTMLSATSLTFLAARWTNGTFCASSMAMITKRRASFATISLASHLWSKRCTTENLHRARRSTSINSRQSRSPCSTPRPARTSTGFLTLPHSWTPKGRLPTKFPTTTRKPTSQTDRRRQ